LRDARSHRLFGVAIGGVTRFTYCYLFDENSACVDTFLVKDADSPFISQLDSSSATLTFITWRGSSDYWKRAIILGICDGALVSKIEYSVCETDIFLETMVNEEDSIFAHCSSFGNFMLLEKEYFGYDALWTRTRRRYQVNERGDTISREEGQKFEIYFFDSLTTQYYTERKMAKDLKLKIDIPQDTLLLFRNGRVFINSEWRYLREIQ
jgi:hypothetical protein